MPVVFLLYLDPMYSVSNLSLSSVKIPLRHTTATANTWRERRKIYYTLLFSAMLDLVLTPFV